MNRSQIIEKIAREQGLQIFTLKDGKMIKRIDANSQLEVAKFILKYKAKYTSQLEAPSGDEKFEMARIIQKTEDAAIALEMWATLNIQIEVLFDVHPFVADKMVSLANACQGNNNKFPGIPDETYRLAQKEIDKEQYAESCAAIMAADKIVFINNVCKKCNQEVKQRQMFYGSYFGCMC